MPLNYIKTLLTNATLKVSLEPFFVGTVMLEQGCHIIFTSKFPDFSRFYLTFLINFSWPTRCNSRIAFIKEMVHWQNKAFNFWKFHILVNSRKFVPNFSLIHYRISKIPWLSRPVFRFPEFSRFSRYSLTYGNLVDSEAIKFKYYR